MRGWYGPRVLGQAQPAGRRLLGLLLLGLPAVSCLVLALPGTGSADPPQSAATARAENLSVERQLHSALLELYALDSQLASTRARLATLGAEMDRLRAERRALAREVRVARRGIRVSQLRLDSRLRLLHRHGGTSALEVVLGARSLGDALAGLDDLRRVTVVNRHVLDELQVARARTARSSRALAARSAGLAAATREAAAAARALERTRAERTAYVADLRHRLELGEREVARLEAAAGAARTRARTLASPAATGPAALTTRGPAGSRTLTVTAVAYALPGTTATGLPVGHGIVAVDPSVIPLGTRMTIPGYGDAVAADTGGAVVGLMIDVWVPTEAQAAAWGHRTVTITLG
jgi:3D (Asp-Asp-Asp) domain-containing protein